MDRQRLTVLSCPVCHPFGSQSKVKWFRFMEFSASVSLVSNYLVGGVEVVVAVATTQTLLKPKSIHAEEVVDGNCEFSP